MRWKPRFYKKNSLYLKLYPAPLPTYLSLRCLEILAAPQSIIEIYLVKPSLFVVY